MTLGSTLADPQVIQDLYSREEIESGPELVALIESLKEFTSNEELRTYAKFYVFAAIFDLQIQYEFNQAKERGEEELKYLIDSIKDYFNWIENHGLNALLSRPIPDGKGEFKSVQEVLKSQLDYHQAALKEAVVIDSLIASSSGHYVEKILWINAKIQSGRHFSSYIRGALSEYPEAMIAMIVDTTKISETNNWIALRASDKSIDLSLIAAGYKEAGLASNAGGHAQAAAIQMTEAQMQVFLNQVSLVSRAGASAEGSTPEIRPGSAGLVFGQMMEARAACSSATHPLGDGFEWTPS